MSGKRCSNLSDGFSKNRQQSETVSKREPRPLHDKPRFDRQKDNKHEPDVDKGETEGAKVTCSLLIICKYVLCTLLRELLINRAVVTFRL